MISIEGWIHEYLIAKKGIKSDYKEEWGWKRYLLNDKMVGAICKNKEKQKIVTLKCEPLHGEMLREEFKDIIPGFYMNKKHWNSVILEWEVPKEVITIMMEESYQLVYDKLSKKAKKEWEG